MAQKINRDLATYEAFVTINLVNSRSLSEVLYVSASAIIGVMNTIVLPGPYVNMRERISFVTSRYRSCRQCFDLHDRVISDERGICMPVIGKVGRYSYNDIYEQPRVSMTYNIHEIVCLRACLRFHIKSMKWY